MKTVKLMLAILATQNSYCYQSAETINSFSMAVEDYQSGLNQNLRNMIDARAKLAICLEFNSQMADLNIENILSFKQQLDVVSQADLAKDDALEKILIDSETIKWSVDIQRKNIAYMKNSLGIQREILCQKVQWLVCNQLEVLDKIESIGLRRENRCQEEISTIERLCKSSKQLIDEKERTIDEQDAKIKLAIDKTNKQIQAYKEIDSSKLV